MARRSSEAIAKADFGALIAERAYFKAEQRGFSPGHELEDWLAAEREIAALGAGNPPAPRKSVTRRKNGTSTKLE